LLSPTFPLGDAIETFIRREDAERFVEEVRSDDPELASYLRIERRELEAGGLNEGGCRAPPAKATQKRRRSLRSSDASEIHSPTGEGCPARHVSIASCQARS
jgi:hypothetical protein